KQDLIRVPDPENSNYVLRTLSGVSEHIGLLGGEFDYKLLRAVMVLVFLMFSYGKWFEYAARMMVNFTTHGPLIFWMYPLLGLRGESYFLGASEVTTAALFFAGFWN